MTPTVYFCTVVHNRWENFKRLAQSFAEQTATNCVLCAYDWNSQDHAPIADAADLKNLLGCARPIRCRYGFDPNPDNFGVTIGKNQAFKIANPADHDIVFFIDCDVVIPPTMTDIICRNVKLGVAYFPILYSLYQGCPPVVNGSGPQHKRGDSRANGWWRSTGFGSCGFTAADFAAIGKWDERFGARYGGDDNDIHGRANQKLTVVRDKVDGFFHFWHPYSHAKRNPRLKEIPWHPLYEGAKSD